MKAPRQVALTAAWLVGGVLFASGGLSLWRAGASTPTASVAPAPVTVGVAAGAGAASLGGGAGPSVTDRLIHTRQQQADAAGDAPSYTKLAAAYMQKARETGDVTYYALADGSVGRALKLDPKNFDAVTTAAWVHLSRHDFRGAADLARQSLRLNSYHSETYGILGDAQVELGDYSGATRSYQKMVDLKPGLASYNRASHIHWLYGETPGATQLMRLAIGSGGTFAENVSWCQAQLGDDYFALGAVVAAESAYKTALRTFPRSHYALSGLARLYAGEGRFGPAVAYYQKAIAVVPLPQYVSALGDTYARMGRPVDAQRQYATVETIFHLYDVNGINVGIDRAQFYADHNLSLRLALTLARAEAAWRHDIRTQDILAWALYKNKLYSQALAAEKKAMSLGTRDAGFYVHLGLIYTALGDVPNAKQALQGGLMLNPLFDMRLAPVAVATLRRLESLPALRTLPTQRGAAAPGHISVGVPGQ